MSRGDQRERDRAKNQAKQAAKQKAVKTGDPLKRNENDKQALEAKVAAKKAAQEQTAAAQASSATTVQRKKVAAAQKDNSLDALLNAGLSSGKKSTAKA